ncbi:MAG: response regulator [Deltaproteobacteria bacterium]|nr:response regulator [Deltaproteobacteria bacterium]
MTQSRRILFAEDNLNDIELTLGALAEHHLANEVVIVRDGAEALDYLYRRGVYALRTNDEPVLILLDIKMPKVDGLEVLRQIKQDEQLKMIPVVMMTSSQEEKDIIESYRLGVNAYVLKPVDFEQFIKAVQSLGLFWLVLNQPPSGSLTSAS